METSLRLYCPKCGVTATANGAPFKNTAQVTGHIGRCRFGVEDLSPATAGTVKASIQDLMS